MAKYEIKNGPEGKTSKEELQKLIEAYKAQSPEKYELKKEELAKKLAAAK